MGIALTLILFLLSAAARAESTAMYIANEGVLVSHEETKILFDPLASDSYGQYELIPAAMKADLMAGAAPFDGVDAVLVSHYHGDHFAPADILALLRARPSVHLYAPVQAISGMRDLAVPDDAALFERVVGVDLEYGDTPMTITADGLLIEAVRIPHSGWPTRRTDVENIAFRVTLDDAATVLHLGDADTRDVHFARDEDFWEERQTHMAFPPYWYFLSGNGRAVLEDRLNPGHAVGIHVPSDVPDNPEKRDPELDGYDIFTHPGEGRRFRGSE